MNKSHYVSIMNHTNLNLYWVNIGYNIIIHKNLYQRTWIYGRISKFFVYMKRIYTCKLLLITLLFYKMH